jgi:hypothetical protein
VGDSGAGAYFARPLQGRLASPSARINGRRPRPLACSRSHTLLVVDLAGREGQSVRVGSLHAKRKGLSWKLRSRLRRTPLRELGASCGLDVCVAWGGAWCRWGTGCHFVFVCGGECSVHTFGQPRQAESLSGWGWAEGGASPAVLWVAAGAAAAASGALPPRGCLAALSAHSPVAHAPVIEWMWAGRAGKGGAGRHTGGSVPHPFAVFCTVGVPASLHVCAALLDAAFVRACTPVSPPCHHYQVAAAHRGTNHRLINRLAEQ